jgi:hypothetical protein
LRFLKSFIILMVFSFISITEVHGWSNWLTLKTEHFTVFYQPGHEKEAEQVLQTLEFYRPRVEILCGNEKYNFPIVIDDGGLLMAGYNDPGYSKIHIFRFQPGSWAATENWWSIVGVHEYTHELSITKVGGAPGVLTDIFGNSPLFISNFIIPGWILEGFAVYSESQLTPYQGRLNDGLYDAYIGARVADNRFPSILEATFLRSEFPYEISYLYGSEFFNYLTNTYGEETFAKFFNANGSLFNVLLFPKFNIDRAAKKVYGKSFPELWEEWRKAEEIKYQDFRMEGNQITKTKHNIQYMQIYDGKMYYLDNYRVKTGAFEGFDFSNLVERDLATGKERKIINNTQFATPFKIKNGKLFYTEYLVKTGFANASVRSYGLSAHLKEVDLATAKERTILKEEIRSFVILEDGGIIYTKARKTGFGSEIYLREPGAKDFKLLFETEYLVVELESTTRGMIAVARKDWEALGIYMVNIDTGEFTELIQTPYLEHWISFNNEKLFFSANYQKQYSIYCYDFSDGRVYRLTENGYAACSSYDEVKNQLYYIGLNSDGYSIYCQDAVFKEFQLPESPATLPPVMTIPDYQISRGDYRDNLKTLAPVFWSPLIDSDAGEYGVYFEGGDAIEDFPWYSVEIGYNSDRKEYFSALDMEVNFFAPLQMALSCEKDDETTAKLTMDYPMFSMIDIGVSLGRDPDYDGVEIEPFIGLGEFLKVSAPRSKLKNGDQRNAFYAQLKLRQYLPGSELEINAKYIDDPQNPDSVFDAIRGYDDELAAKEGSIYTFDYSRPFWKIRNGFWNPNIYFEDAIATLFWDEAVPKDGDKQSSYGLELHIETKMAYDFFPLDLGYRFVRNNEKENTHEIFVKTTDL